MALQNTLVERIEISTSETGESTIVVFMQDGSQVSGYPTPDERCIAVSFGMTEGYPKDPQRLCATEETYKPFGS
jgi:hypothetical protein